MYYCGMPELAAPLAQSARAWSRLELIERMWAQKARLESELRVEIAAFASEDHPFGVRSFVCDELGLALAESSGTADRLIDTSQLYVAHPAVMARVGLPIADGGWSVRHADALLDGITGLGFTEQLQQHVVQLVADHPDARTPHQIRKAAQAAVMVLDPEGAERRLAKARANRRVGVDSLGDGSGSFWAAGTASQMAMVMASIDCAAGPKQPGDARNLDQRRFDAFMDLICGRALPGQWQALVVVTLETLTGDSEEPAEIPGLGLISAGEARDVLAHADIRRAVVDERGELVSVDSLTHHPDLPEPINLDEPHPDQGLSLETEPTPLDLTPEHVPAEDDLTWLMEQEQHAEHVDEQIELVVVAAMSTLEAELTALLAAHVPARLISIGASEDHWPWTPIEINGWTHGPDHGGRGGGSDGPSDGPSDRPSDDLSDDGLDSKNPPEPEPPSLDDQQWAEATVDREAQDALEPPPRYQREPWTPYPRHSDQAPRWTSWTRLALTAALAKVSSAPVDHRPLTSTAYALPPRLARFVKHRDITCSFPGCRRLAWCTENDHLLPWPAGRTTADNIDSKCKHHHQAKTHGGYHTERLTNGAIRWTTPLGRSYDRHPRPLLRGF